MLRGDLRRYPECVVGDHDSLHERLQLQHGRSARGGDRECSDVFIDVATPTQHKSPSAPVAFDMNDADFVRDPYPRYTELRESPQLHRTRDGLWVLTRHADVLATTPGCAVWPTKPSRPAAWFAVELAADQPPHRDHFVLRGLDALSVDLGADTGPQAPA